MKFSTLKLIIPRDIVFREPPPSSYPNWTVLALIERYRPELIRRGFDMNQLIRYAYDPVSRLQILYQNRCDSDMSELN